MVQPINGPCDEDVAYTLAEGYGIDAQNGLMAAFDAAAQPFDRGLQPQVLYDAYTTASYWYAVAKDRRRRARSENPSNAFEAQFAEDYLEALVTSLKMALMVAMSLAKAEH